VSMQSRADNSKLDNEIEETPGFHSLAHRLLMVCGIVGPILFIGIFSIEGILHPGYDPLREPISSLELVSNGWTQSANFILFGLFIIFYAFGLKKELVRGIEANLIPLLQGVVALGLITSGVFVHDPLHTIGDILNSGSVVINFVLVRRFARDPRWRGWSTYSIVTAILTVLSIVAFRVAAAHNGPDGLFERSATFVEAIFTILLTARLLARPGSLAPRRTQTGKSATAGKFEKV